MYNNELLDEEFDRMQRQLRTLNETAKRIQKMLKAQFCNRLVVDIIDNWFEVKRSQGVGAVEAAKELAERVGCKIRQVYNWRTGSRPTYAYMKKLQEIHDELKNKE